MARAEGLVRLARERMSQVDVLRASWGTRASSAASRLSAHAWRRARPHACAAAIPGAADAFVGTPYVPLGAPAFGGSLVSQAIAACARTVGARKRVHAVHSVFMSPGDGAMRCGSPVCLGCRCHLSSLLCV